MEDPFCVSIFGQSLIRYENSRKKIQNVPLEPFRKRTYVFIYFGYKSENPDYEIPEKFYSTGISDLTSWFFWQIFKCNLPGAGPGTGGAGGGKVTATNLGLSAFIPETLPIFSEISVWHPTLRWGLKWSLISGFSWQISPIVVLNTSTW